MQKEDEDKKEFIDECYKKMCLLEGLEVIEGSERSNQLKRLVEKIYYKKLEGGELQLNL